MAVTALLASVKCEEWSCPAVNGSCTCDLPHTLRCTGNRSILPLIEDSLTKLYPPHYVSLLDCTIQDLDTISAPILKGVSLHGLVISSGVLKKISSDAFKGLKQPLEALGLPNNLLTTVPTQSLKHFNTLMRLDLSYNSLYSLQDHSFKGLLSLEFLDLCGNNLQNISASAFLPLPHLKVLQLQKNLLNTASISKLHGLMSLEQLDLSNNAITGPLHATTLPSFPGLLSLNLAHNQIDSVRKGALSGLESLKTLSLKYNMIDVLEDHAFSDLTTLTSLDLAHNRMVAVSEASLAHLNNLEKLDVSNNFLRALTSDLVSSLTFIRELKLDDNDISMIAKGALESAIHLELLTLSENPLNCDCNLADFAEWLKNSSITIQNKHTAVCATPPTLENGLVEELSLDQLVCASDDDLPVNNGEHPMPVSGTRVTLQGFNYDGLTTYLLWKIDTVAFYNCESLFVYEELGAHEVLLEHNRLHCNSSSLLDPHSLPISLETPHLQKGHRYRYCVVMIEKSEIEASLILGCSEVITLTEHISPQILSLKANMTTSSILSIHAQVWPQNVPCSITFYITVMSRRFKQAKLNCSNPRINIKGLPTEGPFKICAVIYDLTPFCIWAHPNTSLEGEEGEKPVSSVMFVIFLTIFAVVILVLYRWLKFVFNRPKIHEQCFLPTPQNEQQHSRYVKLQATTKL